MTTEDPAARRISDEAFGVFARDFGPLARERLRASYGQDWETTLGYKSPQALGQERNFLAIPIDGAHRRTLRSRVRR